MEKHLRRGILCGGCSYTSRDPSGANAEQSSHIKQDYFQISREKFFISFAFYTRA